MRHETAERNGKEFRLKENWQNNWANTTLSVIKTVSTKEGYRLYPHDSLQRDDLQSFLTIEAQKLANQFTPDETHPKPSHQWAAYLKSGLKACSNWHWSTYINHGKSSPSYRAAAQANSPYSRIGHLLSNEAQANRAEGQMSGITGGRIPTPENFLIRLETLEEQLSSLEHQPVPKLSVCIEEGCQQPPRGLQARCGHHQERHLAWWGPGEPCIKEGCPDKATKREWCASHYQQRLRKFQREGIPWDGIPAQTHCSVKDCNNRHEGLGLCKSHYSKYRRALQPKCTTEGCESLQDSRGLCNKHYKRWLKSVAPPCIEPGCNKPQSTRKLCPGHYQRLRAKEKSQ